MAFTVGDMIDGHYRVERRFAGGMGFVYIVLDEIVGKRFAIKQLPALQAENKILHERFRREAAAWLLLEHHPNIVQAHSFHPRPEGPILILECVDGPNFDQLLKKERKLSPVQVVIYARQFCQAMNYAHTRAIPDRGVGVLHRDIKPGNILITRGNQLKVTDFGLAKLEGDSRITGEGQFVGTIAYSSPEQLRSASEVTKASDVYSFGTVLYQALSGRAAFMAKSAADLFRMILETPPLPLEELCPDIERGLLGIVMRCLEKDPAARFGDFAQLEKALAGMEISLRDRRDWSCKKCGYVSRSQASECPVCDSPVDTSAPAAAPAVTVPGWNCTCGARVSHAEKTCPKCGRVRATPAMAVADDDAPLPVSADLVLLQSGSDAGTGSDPGSAVKSQKPSDTAWPAGPAPAAAPPAQQTPADSHIGSAAVAGRQQATATRQLWDPTSTLPSLIELGSRDRLMAWPLERASYTIGRDASMRIRLKDSEVAPYQFFAARLPCGWLVINRQAGTRIEVNGWKMQQRLLRPGDVLHFGATWLAFDAPKTTAEPMPPVPGTWRRMIGPGTQTVRSGGSATQIQTDFAAEFILELPDGREVASAGEPLRIGTTRFCQICLNDPDVAPIQALVAWQADGPHLFDLSGTTAKMVDGRTGGDHLLRDGDAFRFGDSVFQVRIAGDPTSPARSWASHEVTEPPRIALTIAAGPQKGQTALLPAGQPVVLGRHSECDLSIAADPYISRRHLQFTAGDGQVEVKDLGSRHGFSVGPNTSTSTAIARLGDVVKVGQSYLLVHLELT